MIQFIMFVVWLVVALLFLRLGAKARLPAENGPPWSTGKRFPLHLGRRRKPCHRNCRRRPWAGAAAGFAPSVKETKECRVVSTPFVLILETVPFGKLNELAAQPGLRDSRGERGPLPGNIKLHC
jgi:hypothetical protein